MRRTGLFDKDGDEIIEGNYVSLDGNITADDSMGHLPNGWTFDELDVYEVFWDEKIKKAIKWGLRTDILPDNPYNIKYLNHMLSLLYGGEVKIVKK